MSRSLGRLTGATALACLALPAAARAQSFFSYASVQASPGNTGGQIDYGPCLAYDVAGSNVTRAVGVVMSGCNAAPFTGMGTAVATAFASIDPATGTLRTSAAIAANGFTLSQAIPGASDPNTPPDALYASSIGNMGDRFSVLRLTHAVPTLLVFGYDWDGVLHADPQPGGATALAETSVDFGVQQGFTPVFQGFATTSLDGSGADTFALNGSPGFQFTGLHTPGAVQGHLSLAFAMRADQIYTFNYGFSAGAALRHPTYGANCDPVVDPTCPAIGPVDVSGDVFADFTHTVSMTGYRAYDAFGHDISSQVQLSFESGFTPTIDPNVTPIGTTAPEPTTLVLLGSALASLGAAARRRRAA